MKLFSKSPDGGQSSGVTGYFLIEWKAAFSIVLLRFSPGTREAFHSHAFNAWTWWLWGWVIEEFATGGARLWTPSWKPKLTRRECCHRVLADKVTWALSIRGPWADSWREVRAGQEITLTHGRRVVS